MGDTNKKYSTKTGFSPSDELIKLIIEGEQKFDVYFPLVAELRDMCIENFGCPEISEKPLTRVDRFNAAMILNVMEVALNFCHSETAVSSSKLLDELTNREINYDKGRECNHSGVDILYVMLSIATFWEYQLSGNWPNQMSISHHALFNSWFTRFAEIFVKEGNA